MLTTVELYALSKRAQKWVKEHEFTPLLWDAFPMFPDDQKPVWEVPEEHHLKEILPDPELRARASRQLHDPEEESGWAFVAGPENVVWLVKTRLGGVSVSSN